LNKIYLLTEEQFKKYNEFIFAKCGLHFRINKLEFLSEKLNERIREKNFKSFDDYYEFLINSENHHVEFKKLLDILTTKETSFFRNLPQFEVLKEVVLPEILKEKIKKGDRRVKVWSAGCSRGQEPYSIAMTVVETIKLLSSWDIKIIASDISTKALIYAQKALYTNDEIKSVPSLYLKYFSKTTQDSFALKNRIKKLVAFRYHNLIDELFYKGQDIIFCRNVSIYFKKEIKDKLIEKFYKALNPGGYLFIGHSETIKDKQKFFKQLRIGNAIVYKKLQNL